MKNLINFTNAVKVTVPTLAICFLTGCQTTTNALTAHPPNQSLNAEQSQKRLVATLKNALYHSQDWVAEQHLVLKNADDNKLPAQASRLHQIEQCQTEHDKALVAQLKADKITTYKAVKKLSDDKKAPYETIKKSYIDCYHTAQNIAESDDDSPTNLENPLKTDNQDYPEQVVMAMKVLGFKSGQISNFNNFFANSGKIIYTGNYRPLQGKLALQIDAGFENKNLRTHYRLPMVADFNNQMLYLKPDIIMPYTALYLDNKMGMSWQDKWYQFTLDQRQTLPASLSKKATLTAWVKAVTDSFLALPSEQFSTATPAEISKQRLPNLTQVTQDLLNSQVIHWHQNAEQQVAFTNAIIDRYIANMEANIAKDKHLLNLPESEQAYHRKLWEKQKKHLLAYKDKLIKKPTPANDVPNKTLKSQASVAVVDKAKQLADTNSTLETQEKDSNLNSDNLESELESEDVESKIPKRYFIASRPQGQDWYFVLSNNTLKHIYIDNGVTVFDQPANFHTWVTFSPDNRTLDPANQPQTLAKLASTLSPTTIIDGRAEMKRLAELDDSRRLFGQEPKVVKYYREYMKKTKAQAKKDSE